MISKINRKLLYMCFLASLFNLTSFSKEYSEEEILTIIDKKTKDYLEEEKKKFDLNRIPDNYKPFVEKLFVAEPFSEEEQKKTDAQYTQFIDFLKKSNEGTSLSSEDEEVEQLYKQLLDKNTNTKPSSLTQTPAFQDNTISSESKSTGKVKTKSLPIFQQKEEKIQVTSNRPSKTPLPEGEDKKTIDVYTKSAVIKKKYDLNINKVSKKISIFREHKKSYYSFISQLESQK